MKMQHLLDIKSLSDSDIKEILDLAQEYADGKISAEKLRGKIIFNLFFENSTRTHVSFETAAYRLGANVVNWSVESSSMNKGESFIDTITTLNAMHPDAIVIRHSEYGAPISVSKNAKCPVINAGDANRSHPTQALLDALTLRQKFGKDISGLEIAICGDISHSRVASSSMRLFQRLGANVRIIAPQEFMPDEIPLNVQAFKSMKDGLINVNAIMMLRTQKERMEKGKIPNDNAYHEKWGLTKDLLALADANAVVLHPRPMNRGVEISSDVADDPKRSLILRQVENGVFVRMAVLDLLLA